MIVLLLSVVSSSIIFMIFKLFDRFNIDTFQAIVVNYFTAFSCGFILYGNEWKAEVLEESSWMYFSALCAILFISLFWLMAKSSQKNGVAITSMAVKMSMAFSFLLMVVLYSESIGILRIIGVSLAFLGIYLVVSKAEGQSMKNNSSWMLVVLFVGSGILDFSINYIQKEVLVSLTPSLFSAIGFGLAGVLGIIILVYKYYIGLSRFHMKNIYAGLLLGIPNYFSIYLLMSSYQTTGWKDGTVLSVTNVSVVILSALIGFIFFKEKTSIRRILGLVSAILAILILALNN